MDNACVIGWGNVGKATGQLFGIDKYYDPKGSTIELKEAKDYKYVFICLPTPTLNGECYIDDIVETVRTIASFGGKNIFIIRSTIIPGTGRFISGEYGIPIVVIPEFGSEKTMVEDVKHPPFVVIGSQDQKYGNEVRGFYEGRLKGTEYIMTDTTTAEMIKYTLNSFFATKVAFANEIYDICQRNNANYEKVRECLEKHPWGSKKHFIVNYEGKRGLRGMCLPKDLAAFVQYSKSELLREVKRTNGKQPDSIEV